MGGGRPVRAATVPAFHTVRPWPDGYGVDRLTAILPKK
jgi:hypothetical protein